MEVFAIPLIFAVVLGFVGYRHWLRQQQRLLVHKERLAALEKGVELPPWPADQTRQALGIEGFLLLSGLIWLALGIGGMIAAFAIVPSLTIPDAPPATVGFVGIPVALVGVAHLIVHRNYRKRKE